MQGEDPDGTSVHPVLAVQFPAPLPSASSQAAHNRMQAIRRHDTKPERLLRLELDSLGLDYMVDCVLIPGVRRRADMCFKPPRVAVFIDGCFWHSCPLHATLPKANREWWQAKLEANRRRDADTDRMLNEAGWIVLRFWEHEAAKVAARVVANVLMQRRFGD